jgi:hypothetical protein
LKSIFLVSFAILLSCNQRLDQDRKNVLWSMIKSDDVDKIFTATLEILKAKDTSMIDALLYKAEDPRITQRALQKGMSVYQIKMTALNQITGLTPPKRITYKVDTSIINFYKRNLHYLNDPLLE